jgi:hypothetical protein
MGSCGAMSLTQFFEADGLFQVFGRFEREGMRIGEPAFVMRLHRKVQISIGVCAELVGRHAAISTDTRRDCRLAFRHEAQILSCENQEPQREFLI